MNRFEREGFVISWAALGKLHDQADATSTLPPTLTTDPVY